jgi:hypothetical protein
MSEKMWFGNRNYMQWVECPQSGADYGSNGAGQGMNYLNGGAFRRSTFSAAKTFKLTWALTARDNIRPITDYLEGVYGTGAIYWSDPFNMSYNVLAQSMATPMLGGYDGVVLNGKLARPQIVPTSANILGYPVESAIYTNAAATDAPLYHFVPIPPGYTAWVGMHGAAGTGGTVSVRTTNKTAFATGTALTPLSVTNPVRFNYSVDAGPTVDGIEVYLSGTGTVTLSGLMVQVLPTGQTPVDGNFISGQGHSGCSWNERPTVNAYNAALDLVGLTANFIETEQWR